MKLIVIRHGAAAAAGADCSDAARGLTDAGAREIQSLALALARLDVRLDLLLHSPLLRAAQTAELLVPLLAGRTRISTALTSAPRAELLAELDAERTAVVGHEPFTSELVAWLVTGQRELGAHLRMEKGAAALLEGEPRPAAMTLLALVPPRVLHAARSARR